MPQINLASRQQGAKGDAGPQGTAGTAGVGAQGLWQPADNGLVAAVYDPLLVGSGSALLSAGFVYLAKAKMSVASAITNAHLGVRSPASAGVAGAYLGVYTAGGSAFTLLGQTADFSGALSGSTIDQKIALTTPTASQAAGNPLWIAFLFASATTAVTTRAASIGDVNTNLSSTSPYRVLASTAGGLSALPSTLNFSATSSGGFFPWVALS